MVRSYWITSVRLGPTGSQVCGRVLLDHKCVVGSYWITSVWSGPTGSHVYGRVLLDHMCMVESYWITSVWLGPTGSQVCGRVLLDHNLTGSHVRINRTMSCNEIIIMYVITTLNTTNTFCICFVCVARLCPCKSWRRRTKLIEGAVKIQHVHPQNGSNPNSSSLVALLSQAGWTIPGSCM